MEGTDDPYFDGILDEVRIYNGVVGRDWVESHGGQVVLVPLRAGCSTSAIIDRIRGGKG